MSKDASNIRRSLRVRVPKKENAQLDHYADSTQAEEIIREVYLQTNSNVSEFHSTGLETIYEAPKGKNIFLKDCMGAIKLRRQCRFTSFFNPSKHKIKLRKNKSNAFVKRIGVKVPTGLNVTIEQVEHALQSIACDKNEENGGGLFNINPEPMISDSDENYLHYNNSEFNDQNKEIVNSSFGTSGTHSPRLCAVDFQCDTSDKETDANNVGMDDDFYLSNLDLLPTTHTGGINKSQQHKRRSGKVQPLSSNNQVHHPTLLEVQKKDNHAIKLINKHDSTIKEIILDQNQITEEMEVITNSSIVPSVLDSGSSLHITESKQIMNEISFSDSILTSQDVTIVTEKGKTKNKCKPRKRSGLHQPLYKTLVCTPSPKSQSPLPIERLSSPSRSGCSPQIPSSSKPLSPTLFEQLKINSPEPPKLSKGKKLRRKSARLSHGKRSSLGTMWSQSASPNTSTKLPLLNAANSPPLPQEGMHSPVGSDKNVFKLCTKKLQDFSSNLTNCNEEPNNKNCHDSLKFAELANSPMITGIFDCSARITKNRNIIMKKGYKINSNNLNLNIN